MDSQYLKETVGDALIESLSSVLDKQPTDPIEYLGLMLLQYIRNKEGDLTHFPKRDFKIVQIPPNSVVKQVEVNVNTKEIVIQDEETEEVLETGHSKGTEEVLETGHSKGTEKVLETGHSEKVEKVETRKEGFGNKTNEVPTVDQIDIDSTAPAKEMDEVVLIVDVNINTSEDLVDKVSEDVDKAPIEQMTEEQVTPAEDNTTTTNESTIEEVKESESDAKERILPPQENLTKNQSTPLEENQSTPAESAD